jgi:DNA-directed RNA polymerase specialized sigma subunit
MIKNDSYDVDYTKRLSQEEFMSDYDEALEELPYLEKMAMRLSYDAYGYPGLTINEISDYIGVEPKEVVNAKRRVLNKLKKDKRFDKYRKN